MRKGAMEEAAGELTQALRIDPLYTDAHNNLGVLLARTGRLEEAMSHFSRVLELNPNDPDARRNLDHARELMSRATTPGG